MIFYGWFWVLEDEFGKYDFDSVCFLFFFLIVYLGEDLVLSKKRYLVNNLINFLYIFGNEMLRVYFSVILFI